MSYRIDVQKTAQVFLEGKLDLELLTWYNPRTNSGCIRTAAYLAEGFQISSNLHNNSRVYLEGQGMTKEYDRGLSYSRYLDTDLDSQEFRNGHKDRDAVLAILRTAGSTTITQYNGVTLL